MSRDGRPEREAGPAATTTDDAGRRGQLVIATVHDAMVYVDVLSICTLLIFGFLLVKR